jgi:hypothetical protein
MPTELLSVTWCPSAMLSFSQCGASRCVGELVYMYSTGLVVEGIATTWDADARAHRAYSHVLRLNVRDEPRVVAAGAVECNLIYSRGANGHASVLVPPPYRSARV